MTKWQKEDIIKLVMDRILTKHRQKVLVAMSGGVDSSVAAALLLKAGYFVAGAYMKNFSPESWSGVVQPDCPWEQDVADAKAVCDKLGIEFQSFNFEREYREKVIDYFFNEYAIGRTPNPDVRCNKEIKFGLFLQKARELGFDYIATGHYARVKPFPPLARGGIEGEVEYELLKGVDARKDQSYFLYTLTQEQLRQVLFPIGEYTKTEVRQLAREFGLPTADKKDSQGICFVGQVNLREFLKQRLPEKIGEIIDASGQVIGRHRGAWYYTVGQRHGLGIGGQKPYYVAKKDVTRNTLTVATKEYHRLVYDTTAVLKNVHWISSQPRLPLSCKAKIRYQQPNQVCTIFSPSQREQGQDGGMRVVFEKAQFAIAPGQSIVFYKDDRVLGGGIINI